MIDFFKTAYSPSSSSSAPSSSSSPPPSPPPSPPHTPPPASSSESAVDTRPSTGYPPSYYADTILEHVDAKQSLSGGCQADACVVGGGLAGIATALGLVQRGRSVVLVEKGKIASEASGRNGGLMIPGFAVEGEEFLDHVGDDAKARMLYAWTLGAMELIKKRVAHYSIRCDIQHVGMVSLSCFRGRYKEDLEGTKRVNEVLGTHMEVWPPGRVRELYKSDFYHHAIFDPTVCTVHPLNLSLGLARAAVTEGATVYENTGAVKVEPLGGEVVKGKDGSGGSSVSSSSVRGTDGNSTKAVVASSTPPTSAKTRRWRVHTQSADGAHGWVDADDVVLAGGSSLPGSVEPRVAHSLVPLLTYILVTEPLGDELQKAFTPPYCVVDDRFSLNYYRRLPDGRLLWGGLATSFPVSQARLEKRIHADLCVAYPQLAGVKADYVWGGAVTYGFDFMPLIGTRAPGLWYCTGFGGHGLVPTTLGGELVAAAIAEGDTRWKVLADLYPLRYVGWPATQIVGTLGNWWYRTCDWAGLTWQRWGW